MHVIWYLQAPSGQLNLSLSAAVNSNFSRKNKQLPVPDLWPQKSVPENWEDIEDSFVLVFFNIDFVLLIYKKIFFKLSQF